MAQQPSWARAVKRVLGQDAGYVGMIETVQDKTYVLDEYCGTGKQLSKLVAKLSSGTSCSIKLQKNGVDIPGSTLAVTSAQDDVDLPVSAQQTLANGDRLTMIVSASTGQPEDLSFSLLAKYV